MGYTKLASERCGARSSLSSTPYERRAPVKNRSPFLISKKWLRHIFRGLHFALAPLARAALRAEKALRRKAFRSRRTEGELPQSGKRSPPGGRRRSRITPGAAAPGTPKKIALNGATQKRAEKRGAVAMGPALLYRLGAGYKRSKSGKAGTRASRPRRTAGGYPPPDPRLTLKRVSRIVGLGKAPKSAGPWRWAPRCCIRRMRATNAQKAGRLELELAVRLGPPPA